VDCERFDRIVLDLLYDELDELTAAAARRHLEHCARCRGILAGLRATREVGALPLVDPPDGLELRILDAERKLRGQMPLRKRAGRAVSVLAGYAMRPQLGMAATLLLVIGVGLVFFRGRPSDHDTVSVTERGVAENDPEPVTVLPKGADRDPGGEAHGALASAAVPETHRPEPVAAQAPALKTLAAPSPAPTAAEASDDGTTDGVYQSALAAYHAGRYKEARQQFESVVARGGPQAPEAALYASQATKSGEGCGAAAPLFDQVSLRYPGTHAGYQATWEAAGCYEALGDLEKARRSYQALLDETSYATRAAAAIAELDRIEGTGNAVASRKTAAKAAAKSSLDPQVGTGSGSNAPSTPPQQAAPPQAAPPPAAAPQAPSQAARPKAKANSDAAY
jgi:TolA-binding protein